MSAEQRRFVRELAVDLVRAADLDERLAWDRIRRVETHLYLLRDEQRRRLVKAA